MSDSEGRQGRCTFAFLTSKAKEWKPLGKANPNVQAVHEVKRFEPFREG